MLTSKHNTRGRHQLEWQAASRALACRRFLRYPVTLATHTASLSQGVFQASAKYLFGKAGISVLHTEREKGKRKEKIHLIPTKSTYASIGRGASF